MDMNEVFSVEEAAELAHTQSIRRALISTLTTNGSIPGENSHQSMLVALLKDSDHNTFSRVKLKHDKKRDDKMGSAVHMVGELLRSVNPKNYRPVAASSDREIPSDFPERTFVPGELDIGNEPLTSQQVMVN